MDCDKNLGNDKIFTDSIDWKGVNEETTNPTTRDAVQTAICAVTSQLIRRISSGRNPMSNILMQVGYVIYQTSVLRIIEYNVRIMRIVCNLYLQSCVHNSMFSYFQIFASIEENHR